MRARQRSSTAEAVGKGFSRSPKRHSVVVLHSGVLGWALDLRCSYAEAALGQAHVAPVVSTCAAMQPKLPGSCCTLTGSAVLPEWMGTGCTVPAEASAQLLATCSCSVLMRHSCPCIWCGNLDAAAEILQSSYRGSDATTWSRTQESICLHARHQVLHHKLEETLAPAISFGLCLTSQCRLQRPGMLSWQGRRQLPSPLLPPSKGYLQLPDQLHPVHAAKPAWYGLCPWMCTRALITLAMSGQHVAAITGLQLWLLTMPGTVAVDALHAWLLACSGTP